MVPGSPLLNLTALLRGCCRTAGPSPKWFGGRAGVAVRYYTHGRLALAEGLLAVMAEGGHKQAAVYVPSFICAEALESLRRIPVRLVFYPLLEDLSPDWRRISRTESRPGTVHALLLVHYFGFPRWTAAAEGFCRENGMLLLEDGAHLMRPPAGPSAAVFSIFCPRKLLPVPSGAALVFRDRLAPFLREVPAAGRSGFPAWLSMKLLQRVLTACGMEWRGLRKLRGLSHSEADSSKNSTRGLGGCGWFIQGMLAAFERDLDPIARRRRRSYSELAAGLSGVPGVRILFPSCAEDVCPYVFPLIVGAGLGRVLSLCEKKGIPAAPWPLLPLEISHAPEAYPEALWMRDHLLLLPIHQSLGAEDVEQMVDAVRAGVS